MDQESNEGTRRRFFASAGAAAGIAAVLGGGETVQAQAAELNAVNPTPEQLQAYMAMDHDGPIVMVNLLKFKPDGGEAEYRKYGEAIQPILEKIGAKLLFSGRGLATLIGGAFWDAVALVEYPNKMALVQMAQSPEYQAIHHHREAGLEGQINLAVARTGP